jgi:hypothetical protein
VTSVDDFACISHANPWQNPQCAHAGRPPYGCELIAIGAGNGCRPSLRAPRSNSTPEDFTGKGGIGYGRERGGSKGLAPASPETPTSHSTLV